jgi:enoyl-CoA hydratase/carnithine racemase
VADVRTGAPWPGGPLVVDLDRLGGLSLDDLEALERRTEVSIGAVSGACEGPALATALAVDLLVAAPGATFGRPGDWSDVVIRRGTGVAGRKVTAYLALTGRTIDAELARTWGIVSRIADEPLAAAATLADEIAARSPRAVATILRQAHGGAAADYTETRLTGRITR